MIRGIPAHAAAGSQPFPNLYHMEITKVDVCLVQMPYASLAGPSAALGILHALLEADGLNVKSVYANLLFAEEIGPATHTDLWSRTGKVFLTDWTFSHIAFPSHRPDPERFVAWLRKCSRVHQSLTFEDLKDALTHVRRTAAGFTDRLAQSIVDQRPRIVGCSSSFLQHVPSLALIRRIRDLAPDLVTILGGANCETVMGQTNHKLFPAADYVVSGEADELVVGLIRDILDKGREIEAGDLPTGVFGPVHRKVGYPSVESPGSDDAPRAVAASLADSPVPNYDDYFETLQRCPKAHNAVRPSLAVETSRGCWKGEKQACSFCGLNGHGMRYRRKPTKQVLRDLEELSHRHGVYDVCAVQNTVDLGHLRTLIPEIKQRGSPYRLFFATQSTLSRSQVKALRDAGVMWIQPGIESLSSEVLKLMNKGCHAWQNIQLLKWCRQYGVAALWNLLHGFPGEKDDWYMEMAETIPLLAHLQAPNTSPVGWARYSVFHQRAEEFGLELKAPKQLSHIYPWSQEDLDNLPHTLEDVSRKWIKQHPVLAILMVDHPGLTAVERAAKEWIRLFDGKIKPVLTAEVVQDKVLIRDTRPAAVAPDHTLQGLRRDVFVECDDAPPIERLFEKYSAKGIPGPQLEQALDDLVLNKLVIKIDGRLVALALREPIPDLPSYRDAPGAGVAGLTPGFLLGRKKVGSDIASVKNCVRK